MSGTYSCLFLIKSIRCTKRGTPGQVRTARADGSARSLLGTAHAPAHWRGKAQPGPLSQPTAARAPLLAARSGVATVNVAPKGICMRAFEMRAAWSTSCAPALGTADRSRAAVVGSGGNRGLDVCPLWPDQTARTDGSARRLLGAAHAPAHWIRSVDPS